jgi:hypothetical protein
MKIRSCWKFWAVTSLIGLILLVPRAEATVIAVGTGAFGGGSTLSTFTGIPDGTEVNGLTVDGILYSYSLGNGHLLINGGPGFTNNVSPPNIVSMFGSNTGILTLTFPTSISVFGYGYAVLSTGAVANATTITLFNGATNVGSLSYNSVPDPLFSGGFAGIQSTIAFNSAQLTFNSAVSPAFAVDNVRTSLVAAVPEPSTVVLLGTGLGFLWFRRRTGA